MTKPNPLTGSIIPAKGQKEPKPDPMTGSVIPAGKSAANPTTVKELKAYAKTLGLATGGTKAELTERIEAHLAAAAEEPAAEED